MKAKSKWMPQLAMLLLALGVMLSGCDAIFPKKVAAEDCKKWVDHAFDVIKEDMEGAMKKCPAEMKKMMKKSMDKGMDKAKDDAVDECKEQVGQKYEGKEADCFMKASTFKDMKACKFKVADGMGKGKKKKSKKSDDDDDDKKAKDDDEDPVEVVKKACEKAGGGGGDDDDDKPKKKKKGGDDD